MIKNMVMIREGSRRPQNKSEKKQQPVVSETVETLLEPRDAANIDEAEVQTVEEAAIELDTSDLEDVIADMPKPEGPQNDQERKVVDEWNAKFEALQAEERRLDSIQDVETIKETSYGGKVQEAPALEDEWQEVDEFLEEIPAEFKDGKWVASQKKVELPVWLQEGHEDEGEASDVEAMWKAVTDDLARQEARNQGRESEETAHLAFEKEPYDDLEPPIVDEFMVEFDSERAETIETPAFQQFENNIDAVASGQFDARKKEAKGFLGRISETAKRIGGVAGELRYKADEMRKSVGLENLGGKMANIKARSRNLTESSLSKIAGAVMAASKEAEYFLKTPRKERKLRAKYSKELEDVKARIDLREKYPVPGVEGEEELQGLRELREIIIAAGQ